MFSPWRLVRLAPFSEGKDGRENPDQGAEIGRVETPSRFLINGPEEDVSMASYDIYNLKRKLERYVERIKEDPLICQANKQHILSFFDFGFATGLSEARVLIYAQRLFPLAKMLGKDFKSATKEDIQAIVGQIERNPEFRPGTKHFYKVTLKKFYKWLEGNNETHPDKVRWIKSSVKNGNRMLPEELLTYEEILKMIEAAKNPRDKALVAILYESGCRIGELAGIKIKHISFDQYGAQVMVDGKTGARRVRLLTSVALLTNWLEYHPWRSDPNASLWPRLTHRWKGQQLRYQVMRKRIAEIAEKAGVHKRVNPHSFRHARSTQLARMGLSEMQLSSYLGWVPGTRMAATYVHLAGKDVDNALLKAHGIPIEENNGERLACPRCMKENFLNTRFCSSCGMPLNMSAAVEIEDERQDFEKRIAPIMELMDDPEVRAFLISKSRRCQQT